jgi:hypothetical protein
MRTVTTSLLLVTLVLPCSRASGQDRAQLDLSALTWRNIGPFRDGHASAVAGVAADPFT